MAKISFNNVYKTFGKNEVLKGVNLEVNSQNALVVIGGSGSGKSVLIKHILGIYKADAGSIKIDDQDITKLSNSEFQQEIMPKFGMLFQGGALFDSFKIWYNVAFGLLHNPNKKISKQKAYDIAIEKLCSVGLSEDVANLYPAELSGGMQKRVALARAIATNPEIILFDEPTTGLDPIMTNVINNLIVKCTKEIGATTITITHNMASVREIADKVALLYGGKIVWCDSRENLDNSNNEYVAQFIAGKAEGPISA